MMTEDSKVGISSSAATSVFSGNGPKLRVVLASQLREDNFHLNRLNKLANDAQVRKYKAVGVYSSKPKRPGSVALVTTTNP